MKQRSERAFNAFSLSALDLFASAMGMFIVLAVILFPYFGKSVPDMREIERLRARTEALRDANRNLHESFERIEREHDALRRDAEWLADAESSARRLPMLRTQNAEFAQRAAAMEARLKRTFLIVRVAWEEGPADVDLHIVDPQGNEYFYGRPNTGRIHYNGSPAELTLDATSGPGLEIYFNPEAESGDYRIYLNLFGEDRAGGIARAHCVVIHRNGRYELPAKTLTVARGTRQRPWTAAGTTVPATAIVTVTAVGDVHLR
jgi:hypothetical protein